MHQLRGNSGLSYSVRTATASKSHATSASGLLSPSFARDNHPIQPAGNGLLRRLVREASELDRHIRLPQTAREFSYYFAGLILVFFGMVIHVYLSAQILHAQVNLQEIQAEHAIVQQQNSELVWRIARETNLQRVETRLVALGYVPVAEREFVFMPADAAPPVGPDLAVQPEVTDPVVQRETRPRLNVDNWSELLTSPVDIQPASASYQSDRTEQEKVWTPDAGRKWWTDLWQKTAENSRDAVEGLFR